MIAILLIIVGGLLFMAAATTLATEAYTLTCGLAGLALVCVGVALLLGVNLNPKR